MSAGAINGHAAGTARSPRVAIIGSGFGGLGMAIKLQQAGVDDLCILERAGSVGGTWRDNTYPGAACDIPAHLYSYSFAPSAEWSTVYPRQPEVRAYLERLTDEYGLRRYLHVNTEVVEAEFVEAEAVWHLATADGRAFTADALVAAVGPLSDPRIPNIPGREDFAGEMFHSARWDHDVDLAGKRVGVLGTGASSVQLVPHVADQAGELKVFQRSAPWIVPRLDRTYSPAVRKALRSVPGLRALYRRAIYWQKEARFIGFDRDSRAMRVMQRAALAHMRRSVKERGLREKLTPDYAMGCKRILVSSDYYPAVARDHVEVVTDPIDHMTPGGIRTASGRQIDLDVVVWATGFAVDDPLGSLRVTGLGGRDLGQHWGSRPAAHLGTTVPGFPNAFLVLGPNTGLAHNSMVYMMESQYDYIVDAIRRLRRPEVAYLDVRADALEGFQSEVSQRNDGLVWASGCSSWYLSADGHNFTLWPGYTFEYRKRTQAFDAECYRVVTRDELPPDRSAEEPVPA
jgi:cation diffusion facilitator CzcD-associated flavoprotein CzcO